MTRTFGVAAAGMAAAATLSLFAADATAADKVTWNISIWGNPRAVTAGMESARDYVKEKSGGNFDLNLAYGETLSPAKENIDAVKIEVVEGAQFCSSYGPGKTPVMTALDLPFLPLPNADATIAVHEAFYDNPHARKEMARWNAKPYISTVLPQYEFMGTGAPPEKLEDWKGLRVRALGGLGEAMKLLGAIPTTVPAPEVYTGLERGMFNAASFPFSYAHGAYKLHEVSKWYTANMAPGTIGCHFIVGQRAWDSLPAEYQQVLTDAKPGAYEAYKAAYKAGDEQYLPIFEQMGLTKVLYSEEKLAQFQEVAGQPVWEAWVADMDKQGIPGQEVLDYVLASAKKAGS